MIDACQFIDAYIDGELGSDQVALFESHLSMCAECRTEVQVALDLDSHLAEAWSEVKSPSSLRRVTSTKRIRKETSTVKRWVGAVLVIAASVLFFVVMADWRAGPNAPRRIVDFDGESNSGELDQSELPIREVGALVSSLERGEDDPIKTIFVESKRISPDFTIVTAYSVVAPVDPLNNDLNTLNERNENE